MLSIVNARMIQREIKSGRDWVIGLCNGRNGTG